MSANFAACWKQLLVNEGGFTVDNGGATMWGVTEAVARRYGYVGDMRSLPQSTAMTIAQEEYWTPHNLGALPTWAAFQLLDAVYNGGGAVKWAQQVVGCLSDGNLGPVTVAAIAAMNPWEFLSKFNNLRLQYLADLKQPQYADGRMNRIANNLLQGNLI